MPGSQDSSYGPSPPTFKRQGPRKPRRRRPAPSPPPPPPPVPEPAPAPAGHVDKGKGKSKAREEGDPPGSAQAHAALPAALDALPRGMHPAVARAWLPRGVQNAQAGPAPRSHPRSSGASPGGGRVLAQAKGSPPPEHDDDGGENEENLPLRSSFSTAGSPLCGGEDALPPSVDTFFADVCPKTRIRLSSAAKKQRKRRASLSSLLSAYDRPPQQRPTKKRILARPPSHNSSWELHDLSRAPDASVTTRYPISRAAPAVGPAFTGAAELDALDSSACNRMLCPPYRRPLQLERQSASPFDRDHDSHLHEDGGGGPAPVPARRKRKRPPVPVESRGAGVARLARGRAPRGAFLGEIRQTGFAPLALEERENEVTHMRALCRRVSVRELGGRLGALGLRRSVVQGKKPKGAAGRGVQRQTGGKAVPRLAMGREEDAGEMGELDARAADATHAARRLPPTYKPGTRPSSRAPRMRYEPVRRPAPVQAISLRHARVAGEEASKREPHDAAEKSFEKVNLCAPDQRAFRFVQGVKANRALTGAFEPADDARTRAEEPDGAIPTPREGTLLRRGRPPTPRTASKARVDDGGRGHSHGNGERALARPLLRRVSTYAGFLLHHQRQETDPLISGETPLIAAVRGCAVVEEGPAGVDEGPDSHDSSHSHRGHSYQSHYGGTSPFPADPLPARAKVAVLVSPTPSAHPSSIPFPSVPPAQQPRPHPSFPTSSTRTRSSSFERSARAALDRAVCSSPERMLYPPDLLSRALADTAPTSSGGLELRLSLWDRVSSKSGARSAEEASSVVPTMEEEEPPFSGGDAEGENAQPQPPASALLSAPYISCACDSNGAIHAGAHDAEGDDDDPFATGDIPFTALAIAAHTRRMLDAPPRPTTRPRAAPESKAKGDGAHTARIDEEAGGREEEAIVELERMRR